MKYLLDTNICIFLINKKSLRVLDHIRAQDVGDVGVSSVTAAELEYGVAKTGSTRNKAALAAFLLPLDVAPFDADAARAYGEVRAGLEKAGTPIGPLDMLIAAHALSLGCVLVTNNVREFRRVSGLDVEDWTR